MSALHQETCHPMNPSHSGTLRATAPAITTDAIIWTFLKGNLTVRYNNSET